MPNDISKKGNDISIKKRNGGSRLRQPTASKKGSSRQSIAAAYSKRTGPIEVRESNQRGVKVLKWREFVQDITGVVNFTAISFPVQPGIPTLFAWLSNQAIFYQEYRFRKLIFSYETEIGSTATGKVMFAFQEDPSDPLPGGKQEMLENQWKASGAPWEPFSLEIPSRALNALGNKRFIRSGALASNLDVKTYDVGQLIVAVQGTSTALQGELYVDYEIEFHTPILSVKQLSNSFSRTITSGGTVDKTNFMGNVPVLSSSGVDIAPLNRNIIFNRVGYYYIVINVIGTGLHTIFTADTTGTTGVLTAANAGLSNAAADAGLIAEITYTFVCNARGQQAQFNFNTTATTITSSVVTICGFSLSYP